MNDATPELTQAVETLRTLTPGFLPLNLFIEVTRLTVTPCYEVVPVRRNKGITEVCLLKREADDPIWAGELHTPGTVLRATDTTRTFVSAQKRIARELGIATLPNPTFVELCFQQARRGRELGLVHWVEITNEATDGMWFPADRLPRETVESQLNFIITAVEHFERSRP